MVQKWLKCVHEWLQRTTGALGGSLLLGHMPKRLVFWFEQNMGDYILSLCLEQSKKSTVVPSGVPWGLVAMAVAMAMAMAIATAILCYLFAMFWLKK